MQQRACTKWWLKDYLDINDKFTAIMIGALTTVYMYARAYLRRTERFNICIFIALPLVASYRKNEALASVIIFVFVVYSHQKRPKYLGRES